MTKPRESKGGAYEKRGRIFLRVTVAPQKRRAELLPWMTPEAWAEHDSTAEACPCAACVRARDVQAMVTRYREAGADVEMIEALVKSAAGADVAKLAAIGRQVDAFCGGKIPKARPKDDGTGPLTFRKFAESWTDGDLHRDYPDHVPQKKSADEDAGRLEKYVYPIVEDVLLTDFALHHAQAVLRGVPRERSSSTRRQVAQLMVRVMNLAVYPCEHIKSSPLPKGFLPRVKCRLGAHLYPSDDRSLLACVGTAEKPGVPLANRLLYGFLAREGMRKEEALCMTWSDLDLERGAVRLDENKTDDPRAWALDPSVAETLRWWRRTHHAETANDACVFTGVSGNRLADDLREHLERADIDRPELFEQSKARRRMNVHGLRATFVTISLANGKSEAWVMDRTGHRSSSMVNRYRRVARTVAELGLGALTPLADAIPEVACRREHGGRRGGKPAAPIPVEAAAGPEISAERKGFEPLVGLHRHMISNHAPSTTRSPLRVQRRTD